jgi:signal transduction histidine kinase
MSLAAGLNSRITRLAVGRHLPHRTVRIRLTLLYGGLFLVSGAALMAIAYALLVNAGFVFTLQNGPVTGPVPVVGRRAPPGPVVLGAATHPSAHTMAHWRAVARCMRQHGVTAFPEPTAFAPSAPAGVVSDHSGAILVFRPGVQQSPQFVPAATSCGYYDKYQLQLNAQNASRRTQVRQQLLIQSGIALAGMSLLSLGLGWLMAGRVLQPLQDAYEAQRQFVANASHELRAPLTRLRALSEVALANPEGNVDSLRRAHERVLASEQDLEQLIDGLLGLTRGQAGPERREPLDLAALTGQALLARESELGELDLDVHAVLESTPTAGDPRLLDRLIANLIDNAIRHNTPGGDVEITTGIRDRHAYLSVVNSGPTIPPAEVKRLLQPFQRLGAARTGHTNGHGLGLSIVQAIADAHHAVLDARPRPGGGLAVELAFPLAAGALSGARVNASRGQRESAAAVTNPDAPVSRTSSPPASQGAP